MIPIGEEIFGFGRKMVSEIWNFLDHSKSTKRRLRGLVIGKDSHRKHSHLLPDIGIQPDTRLTGSL